MDLFEYQGKALFAAAGIAVLPSRVADTEADAEHAVAELGYPVAVKAQVLTGGRGKAGGVRVVSRPEDLGEAVATIRGLTIKGKPVQAVLLEQGASVLRELYLAITLDRHSKSPLLIFSTRGGVDIEQVAGEDPARPASGAARCRVGGLRGAVPEGRLRRGAGRREAGRGARRHRGAASGRSIASAISRWSR